MAALIRITLICLLIALSAPVNAALVNTHSFVTWLQNLEQDAISSGMSPVTVHAALDTALLDERVVTQFQKQPESTSTFASYIQHIVTSQRVTEGQKQLENYDAILNQISQHYGVPPQIIVALWGMESSFGHGSGNYNVVDSLMTLAYYGGARADFFRKQLLDALRILDQEHLPATALRGSWAGAMGQCQFMPSTYLHYAIDYDNDGHRNIWLDTQDVFASIANYIAAEGWRADQTWGEEVTLTQTIATSEIGLDHQHSLSEWASSGIRALNGDPLPDQSLNASLIQPDGSDGRSCLVYDNFRAIMRWNRSTYFAVSVGLLADRIK